MKKKKMNYEIQINTIDNTVIDCRTSLEVNTTRPWGTGDVRYPFRISYINSEPGQEIDVNGIAYTLPEAI